MVKTFRLPNGVTGVCEERPGSGFVALQVMIDRGSSADPLEESGLTNLMRRTLLGGTTTRSRDQISEAVEAKGGSIQTFILPQTTTVAAIALPGEAGNVFDVLADVVRNPAFPPSEIENTKRVVRNIQVQANQDPGSRAYNKFWEAAFADQPLGAPPGGPPELLASFTPSQVRKKHAELLADPSKIVLSFAGDIDQAAAEKLASQYFGDLTPGKAPPAPSAHFTGGEYREPAETEQLQLHFGFAAPTDRDDDRYAAALLQDLLSGGMSTPIFQEFREKRGLCYTAGASYSSTQDSGVFSISSGSGDGKAGALMRVTIDLLGRVAREGFGAKAMDEARERIMRQVSAGWETIQGAAAGNGGQVMDHGRTVSPEEYLAHLKAVTSDDIRRLAGTMIKSGSYALSAVGPQGTLPPAAEIKRLLAEAAEGLELPEKRPAPVLSGAFNAAAAKNEPAGGMRMTVLENGLKIVTVERKGPLSCGAWVGVGSDNETPFLNGATHMIEHMMFKGTPNYSNGEIKRIVEGELGGQLNAYTTKDKTCYYFYNLLPAALDKIVDICGQMVFFANISEEDYAGSAAKKTKGEREAVFEEIHMCNDEISSMVFDQLVATGYPGQSHGRPILGTEETLSAISAGNLRGYRDQFYAPNNVIFCAAGPVKHEDFVESVRKKYGHLKPAEVAALEKPVWHGGTAVTEDHKAQMCSIGLAADAVSSADPESYAYAALGAVLNGGASSVFQRDIVNGRQLTSRVSLGTEDYRHSGTFYMLSTTTADKVKPLVEALYRDLRGAVENLTEANLDKVKAGLEMGVRLGQEANGDISNAVACNVQAAGRLVPPEEILEGIRRLTVDDIRRVADKILKTDPVLSMVVPPGTDPKLLPVQEELVAMRDGTYASPSAPAFMPPKPPVSGPVP